MRVYSIPMRTRFRGVTRREGVLIRGPAGWGEFSPFPEYEAKECARWLAAAREAAYDGWPPPLRDHIAVNATIPAVSPERAHDLTTASGCRTAKVKVAERGQRDGDDLARVEAVRDALGPTGRLRVDVNGAWDVDHAVTMINALRRFDLEYVEQPCATLAELARVRRRVDVPVAADESIRRAEDPLRVRAALRVAAACGLPVVVSSAVETSVGLAAGLALAAALPELPYACGLATLSLLEGDVAADPLVPSCGVIEARRPLLDEAALARYEVSASPVGAAWRRRVADAQVLMDAPPVIGVVR